MLKLLEVGDKAVSLNEAIEQIKGAILAQVQEWPIASAIGHGEIRLLIHDGRVSHIEVTLKERPVAKEE